MSLENFRDLMQRPEIVGFIQCNSNRKRDRSFLVYCDGASVYIGSEIPHYSERLPTEFFDGIEDDMFAKVIKLVGPLSSKAEEIIGDVLEGHPSKNEYGTHMLLYIRKNEPVDLESERRASQQLSKSGYDINSTALPVGLGYPEYFELNVLKSRCTGEVGAFVIEPRCHGSIQPIFAIRQKSPIKKHRDRQRVIPGTVFLSMAEAFGLSSGNPASMENMFREIFYERDKGTIDIQNGAVTYDSDFLDIRSGR